MEKKLKINMKGQKKFVPITLGKLANLKPFKDQKGVDGRSLVNNRRVEKLYQSAEDVLTAYQDDIRLTHDWRILCGNHRVEMIRLGIDAGRIDPESVIDVIQIQPEMSRLEQSRAAILGNHGHNTTNANAHLVNSDLPCSKKLFKPMYEAFLTLKAKNVTKDNKQLLAIRCGSVFNANPGYLKHLVQTGKAPLTGNELYKAKSNGNTNVRDVVQYDQNRVTIDLRQQKFILARAAAPGIFLIDRLKESGLWKEKLGNNRMFMYLLMELSFQGKLVNAKGRVAGKVTFKQVENVVRTKGRNIKEAASQINKDTDRYLDTLRTLLKV